MQNYFCIEAETALPSTTPPYPTKLYPPPQSRRVHYFTIHRQCELEEKCEVV